ncbi:hypothetical protein SH668x_003741 [Planctomicrobium sp. SH668]|uniref:hypothetical protein n=1 Tax=Planctomicrobium sp. SH668 TaxID=3448126 RepID=UPI003F5B02E1
MKMQTAAPQLALSMQRGRFWRFFAQLVPLFIASLCVAEDRVTYIPEGASGPVIIVGEVVDYTGRDLIFRSTTGSQRLASSVISGIETKYVPAHQRGLEEFQEGKTTEAIVSFQEALKVEPRQWVQREILAMLVKCFLRQDDLSSALQSFREIAISDPLTRHWGIAPLVWAPQTVSDRIRQEMIPWLKSERQVERMLGASLLLFDPTYQREAESNLALLSRDVNPVLSAYGKTQLWRLQIAKRDADPLSMESWRKEIQLMRPELRSGPQYLLSCAYEVQGDHRRSAAEGLWLPYVYPEHEVLAARAMGDAIGSLKRTGLTSEASTLQLELLNRYPWSREASQLRGALKQQPSPNE